MSGRLRTCVAFNDTAGHQDLKIYSCLKTYPQPLDAITVIPATVTRLGHQYLGWHKNAAATLFAWAPTNTIIAK
jgi:hypothetical protein